MGSQSVGSRSGDDDINFETDKIGCEIKIAIVSTFCITVLEADVLALDPSAFAQTQPECLVPDHGIGKR